MIFSNVAAIPLTTVRQDIFRLSRAAVDMLVRMIGGDRGTNIL